MKARHDKGVKMSELMLEEREQPVRERFTVDNDMKAEWCLSKIRSIRRKQESEVSELKRQMKFYEDRIACISHDADEDVAFFEEMLKGYFADRAAEGFVKETKTKVGYKLPTGELIMKHREPEYKRNNDEETIKWLEKKGAEKFVKVKKELDWANLKKAVVVSGNGVADAETGEVIPCIEVVPREDEFVVEVKNG